MNMIDYLRRLLMILAMAGPSHSYVPVRVRVETPRS